MRRVFPLLVGALHITCTFAPSESPTPRPPSGIVFRDDFDVDHSGENAEIVFKARGWADAIFDEVPA